MLRQSTSSATHAASKRGLRARRDKSVGKYLTTESHQLRSNAKAPFSTRIRRHGSMMQHNIMHDDENMVVTAVQELMARWERKHMSPNKMKHVSNTRRTVFALTATPWQHGSEAGENMDTKEGDTAECYSVCGQKASGCARGASDRQESTHSLETQLG